MIDDSLILVVLTTLTFAVTLNLFLTFRLTARSVNAAQTSASPLTMPIGETVPDFEGRRLSDGRLVSSEALNGQANVLIFLTSACGDCRRKVPELAQLCPAMNDAGVRLWIVAMESEWRTVKFFKGSSLLEHVVVVEPEIRQQLNPRSGAPFYAFIDHEKTVLASNFIGDENWLSFVEQMKEFGAGQDTVS